MKRYSLVEEISLPPDAPRLFEAFRQRPHSFFLDSGMDPARLGRWSFLGSDPFLVLRSYKDAITVIREGRIEKRRGNPFDVLRELLSAYTLDKDSCPVPFIGGALGYFSYDLCHFIERLPATTTDDLQLPECYLAFYDTVVAVDNREGRIYLASSGFPEQEESSRLRRAGERLREVRERLLARPPELPQENPVPPAPDCLDVQSNFSRGEYLKAVAAAREYICAGEIYQVNLSQRFEAALPVPPYELYRLLRGINPAPFAAYLDFDGMTVASASPERFLKLTGDLVETRPIKGTRPRGKTPEADAALAHALIASAKDQAENLMIVDLERNDIGRVCRFGSVKVTELAALETFPTVFHLTSTVQGQLRPDKDRIDLLKATFPGGSITGAPKVRAMEIIDELEPTRRSVYTGSIGYLSFSGDMDLSIVIRTFIIKGGRAYFQVGGGIVYDSEPEGEYEETLDKAKALFQALKISEKGVSQAGDKHAG